MSKPLPGTQAYPGLQDLKEPGMDDQRTVNFISNQLSLRKPQRESLQILADVLSQLGLSKNLDLARWLEVIQQHS
jgi:type III restriction enzyme